MLINNFVKEVLIVRKFSKRIMSLLLVLVTLTSVALSATSFSAAGNNTVQTTDAVRLRSSAKIASDNTIATLDIKENLTLLANSTNGWAYVSRSNGTKGFCSVNYLNVPSGSDVVFKGITTDDVYFRKGAGTSYDYISLLAKNTSFSVTDNSNELWVKAKVGTSTGYIYREYTSLTLEVSTPTVDPVIPDDPKTPDWYNSSLLDDLTGTTADNKSEIVNEVFIAEDEVKIEERENYTLTAYTSDHSESAAVLYKSSDTSVVTVTSNGTLKGISKGSAVITAYISGGEISDTCKVIVQTSTKPPVEEELTLSKNELSINVGNHYHLTANISASWKTSNSSIVTVSNGILTAKAKGTATITAFTSTQSVTCTVKVIDATDGVSIQKTTATISAGKSYYNGATSASTVTWTSSDTSVAKVQNGFITAVAPGTAVITAHNTKGTKTCLVTVKDAEPVRFTYSYPNTAAIGETVYLSAVTDSKRTAVKFEVTVGSQVKTINATKKEASGDIIVWTGSTTISSAGTYNVVAYAKTTGDFKTCSLTPEDAKTTVFIRKTEDLTEETKEKRRATDQAIELIAAFEGYSSSVYFDTIANNIPTIGYGKVIYIGDSFYNNMTKKEAYAYLVQTVNEGGFTTALNNYLASIDVYYNQQHFDSLISFIYNLGSNILSADSDFKNIFTADYVQDSESGTEAFINATDVNLRSGAGISYSIIGVLNTGDKVTLVKTTPENNWYQVETADGKKGYVYADYVTKGVQSESDEHYLSKINKKDFTELLLQYHHAGTTCVWGLLYRRIDELDVFFYGEYTRNGSKNVNKFSYKCTVNSSTYI